MRLRFFAAAAVLMSVSTLLAQESAPMKALVPVQVQGQPAEKPAKAHTVKPSKGDIYDESADAQAQIAAALAKASKNNRRVLIQWGANWCGWCRLLHGLCDSDPEIKKKLNYEYDVVLVDIGHWDKNMLLAKFAGADLKAHGVPFLTVLDSEGNVIANQDTGDLEAKDAPSPGHDRAKVLAFLTQHQAAYPKAQEVLDQGLATAAAEHKEVFLHFGAPWCGWCHRLEDWMARPEVAAILAKDFVDIKIDQDRTIDAKTVFEKYCKKPGGIPWFCVLSSDGKVVCTSDGPGGNIGFPGQPAEIDHFVQMMTKAQKNMTLTDIAALRESLEKDNKVATGH